MTNNKKMVRIDFQNKEDLNTSFTNDGKQLTKKIAIKVIEDLKKDKKIKTVNKYEQKNGKCLFIITTTENENFSVYILKEDPYIVNLEKLSERNIKVKKLAIYAGLAAISACTLITFNNPKVQASYQNYMETTNYNDNKDNDFEMMKGYFVRLASNNLTSDDYDSFSQLVAEYISDERTTEEELEELSRYNALISDEYQNQMRARH